MLNLKKISNMTADANNVSGLLKILHMNYKKISKIQLHDFIIWFLK